MVTSNIQLHPVSSTLLLAYDAEKGFILFVNNCIAINRLFTTPMSEYSSQDVVLVVVVGWVYYNNAGTLLDGNAALRGLWESQRHEWTFGAVHKLKPYVNIT